MEYSEVAFACIIFCRIYLFMYLYIVCVFGIGVLFMLSGRISLQQLADNTLPLTVLKTWALCLLSL